jgi:TolB-like protein
MQQNIHPFKLIVLMNKLFFLLFLFLLPFQLFSQTEFDKALNSISTDLSEKLNVLNKKRIVVLYATDVNKSQTTIGKYLADGISVDIVNNPGAFQVFNRDNLEAIAGAKKLIAEGYINAAKAKELGQMLSVDVIVVGTYTVLSNSVKLTLKALDSSSGFVIAASSKDLPLDADARALLGSEIEIINNTNNTTNQRTNPIKTGDFCFKNVDNYGYKATIAIYKEGKNGVIKTISVNEGETKCMYELITGIYTVNISWSSKWGNNIPSSTQEISVKSGAPGMVETQH